MPTKGIILLKLPKDHNLAIELLLKQYEGLMVDIVNRYCTVESYRDDLTQAARMGLIKAYETYNTKKKTKFSSWLYIKIKWEVQKQRNQFYLTSCSPRWRHKRPETYTNVEEDNIDRELNPAEVLMRKEEWDGQYTCMRGILNKLHKKLSPLEREVFLRYYMHNNKMSDILKIYLMAYKAMERIKAKIRQFTQFML
jgi:RNA polymerase sigma factor (sigma-70 family)